MGMLAFFDKEGQRKSKKTKEGKRKEQIVDKFKNYLQSGHSQDTVFRYPIFASKKNPKTPKFINTILPFETISFQTKGRPSPGRLFCCVQKQ